MPKYNKIIQRLQNYSTCNKRHIGAVLVKDETVLLSGFNHSLTAKDNCLKNGCKRPHSQRGTDYESCPAIHAEADAISTAAKVGWDLSGSTIYVSGMPCFTCAKLIVNAGIKKVVIFDDYEIKETAELFKESGIEMKKWTEEEECLN